MKEKKRYLCDVYKEMTWRKRVLACILIYIVCIFVAYAFEAKHMHKDLPSYYEATYEDVVSIVNEVSTGKDMDDWGKEEPGEIIEWRDKGSYYEFWYANYNLKSSIYIIPVKVYLTENGELYKINPDLSSKEKFIESSYINIYMETILFSFTIALMFYVMYLVSYVISEKNKLKNE